MLLKETDTIKDYQPLLIIGVEDIMSLYAEDSKEDGLSNAYKYQLRLDSRLKYLDSSIW